MYPLEKTPGILRKTTSSHQGSIKAITVPTLGTSGITYTSSRPGVNLDLTF